MSSWIILGLSIVAELFATTCLKFSATSSSLWFHLGVLVGYVVAFGGLQHAVKNLPLGLSYAIWAGVGVVGTAVIGRLIWGEALTGPRIGGIALVAAGVAILGLTGRGH